MEKTHIGRLYVSVLAGRKLAVKDIISSDPYVITTVDSSQQKKTKVKPTTLNPDWSSDAEDYIFEITTGSKELVFEIFDKDDMSKDDHMGVVVVNIQDLPDGSPLDPWLDVKKNRKSSTTQGQLHVRILKALDRDLSHETPLFKAIAQGDWRLVSAYLPKVTLGDVVLKDRIGNTPAHLVCQLVPETVSSDEVNNILDTLLRAGADFALLNSKMQSPTHLGLLNPNATSRLAVTRWLSSHHRILYPKGASFVGLNGECLAKFWQQNHLPDSMWNLAFAGGFVPTQEDRNIISHFYPEAFDYIRVLDILTSLHLSTEHFQKLCAEEVNYDTLIRMGPHEIEKLSVPEQVKKQLGAAIEGERGAADDDIVQVKRSDSASRVARLNVDVESARKRRDSIAALENYFKGQVTSSGHSWLIEPKDLMFCAHVGEGAFAKVYRGELEFPTLGKTVEVAIKAAKRKILATIEQVEALKKEFEVMAAVGAPSIFFQVNISTLNMILDGYLSPVFWFRSLDIVKFHGVCFVQGTLNLVSEYCDKGNLQAVLKSDAEMDMKLALKLLVGAAKGLMTLHNWEPPILHRDIKSLNVLVTKDNMSKISDFGTSVFDGQAASGVVGSLPWCAPEVLTGGSSTDKADIYSFGIVMWEVLNRVISGKYQVPYAGAGFTSDAEFMVQHSNGLRPTISDATPEPLKVLMQSCWQKDPSARPSIMEVVSSLQKIQSSLQ